MYRHPEEREFPLYPRIRISLSKPTAVTLADAPVVEVSVDTRAMLKLIPLPPVPMPFPLQGRLDDWIKENDPMGLKKDPVLGTSGHALRSLA
jgi:hypothetical protein